MPITKASGQAVAVAAKGDLVVGSATNDAAVLGVGSADQVLTVDSSTTTGLKWATPAAGGMTLLSTTTLSSSIVTLSSIPSTYNHLQLVIRDYLPSSDNESICFRINSDSAANRHHLTNSTSIFNQTFNSTLWSVDNGNDNAVAQALIIVNIYDYANTVTWKLADITYVQVNATTSTNSNIGRNLGVYNQTGAISSLQILVASGTFGGTALLYGVK